MLARQWEGFTSRPISCKDWLLPLTSDHHGGSAVQGPTLQSRTSLGGLWCLLSLPLECITCRGGWVVLCHDLKLSTGYAGSGASWEIQAKVSHCLCSAWGPPGMSYKAIFQWLLLTLGLDVPRQGQAMNQGWLLLVPGHLARGMGLAVAPCCLFERF